VWGIVFNIKSSDCHPSMSTFLLKKKEQKAHASGSLTPVILATGEAEI
jgi:hypothetical protein